MTGKVFISRDCTSRSGSEYPACGGERETRHIEAIAGDGVGFLVHAPREFGTRPASDLFLDRVAQTIAANHLLANGDRVLVAVSGGPDSVALWRVLGSLAECLRLTLGMVHVNYHLRGEESDEDERFCRQLAHASGAAISVRSCRPPQAEGRAYNLQAWARRARYEVFNMIAEAEDYRRIAVGHQYDDQVETVVAGLIGGRRSFALAGIPRVRGRIIRPLFDCRRAEILAFLRGIGQPYREDRSNRDHRFLRNRIRLDYLPRWRETVNPRIDELFFRWAGMAGEYNALAGEIADGWLKRWAVDSGDGWLSLDLRRLQTLDRRFDFFILRQAAAKMGMSLALPGEHTVRRFGELVAVGRPGTKLMWSKAQVEVSRQAVTLYAERPAPFDPVDVQLDGVTSAETWGIRLHCTSGACQGGEDIRLPRCARKFIGDSDAISPPIIMRGAGSGERIRPLGMVGRRRIADLLAQAGVPASLRCRVPVLEDRRGVFWVVGHHQDDRVKVTAGTRRLMSILVERWPGRED